jgi:hypothetical protein
VYEGPNCEKDITFNYNANFFLYCTLENSRNTHPGRTSAGNNCAGSLPVLTGTPVAGVAMLDRPEKAGYFIFPDLSVRHEGKYRLQFSLYEELKDPRDFDAEIEALRAATPNPQFSYRLDVRTREFTVYSAKKFPGLSNSTELSRCFAEQGCRVRIRREVRMRRREAKRDDFNDDYDHYAEQRARVSATPDAYVAAHTPGTPQQQQPLLLEQPDRPRSASNASQYADHTRRSSMEVPAAQSPYYQHSPQQVQAAPAAPTIYGGPYHGTAVAGSYMAPPPHHPHQHPYPPTSPYGAGHGAVYGYPPPPQGYYGSAPSAYAPPLYSGKPEPAEPPRVAGAKRSYGATFDQQPMEAPLHNGARPATSSNEPPYTPGYAANPTPSTLPSLPSTPAPAAHQQLISPPSSVADNVPESGRPGSLGGASRAYEYELDENMLYRRADGTRRTRGGVEAYAGQMGVQTRA